VVFKISARNAGFINLLAQSQYILMYPKEVASNGYDPKKTIIGTGPWMMGSYTPSSGMEFKRNPDYYESGLPYLDGVKTVFLSEQAAILAQFAAGTFYQYPAAGGGTTILQASDFSDLLNRVPGLRVLKVSEPNRPGSVSFGRGDNPQYFKDDRVRKAVSLAIDRDAITVAIANIEEFRKIGYDVAYHLQNYMPYAFAKFWTDPRGKDMGEMAQWFAFDPAKAKQLMAAAGFANGFETQWHFDNRSGTTPNNTIAVLAESMKNAGIKANLTVDDYNTVFQPKTQVGTNTGLLNSVWITNSDPSGYLSLLFGPGSNRNKLDVNDATFNDLYKKQNEELDDTKRRAILIDTYKYLAGQMWEVPFSTNAESFSLHAGFVRNNWAYRDAVGDFGLGGGGITHYWLDK
jgi:peptide/nickel transport system substrate-binding protein